MHQLILMIIASGLVCKLCVEDGKENQVLLMRTVIFTSNRNTDTFRPAAAVCLFVCLKWPGHFDFNI